jgi:all-trans-8'-apo-beta-carotenal 15,15'-oxygenase
MQRRDFGLSLLATAAGLAASFSPARTQALQAANADGAAAVSAGRLAPTGGCANPAADFAAARASTPWAAGYTSMVADLPPLAMNQRGKLPAGLTGALWRNGPARHDWGGERYRHWFDGDGAIQRFSIAPSEQKGARGALGITHQARFIQTDKFKAEAAAGRMLRQAFATQPVGSSAPRSADEINVANIHVVRHGGKLLALWEGGSATEIDPETLGTRGLHKLSNETAGMPFSAHPRIEPDGTMWNFGVANFQSKLAVYRLDAAGQLQQTVVLPVPALTMVHDFAVTPKHLVFLLPPLVFSSERLRQGSNFLAAHVWRPELGLRVLLLPKAQLDAPRWFELPAGMVFHIGNACEEGGVIRLDFMRAPSAWQAQAGILDLMCGQYAPQENTQMAQMELNLNTGRATQQVLPLIGEFPRVDPRFIGQPYDQVFALHSAGAAHRPGYDAVMRVNLKSGKVDRYVYGDELLVEEHVFVPRPAAGAPREGAGWLIGTALDFKRQHTLFSVFDAQNLAAGPVVQAQMARTLPLGLHGSFVTAT